MPSVETTVGNVFYTATGSATERPPLVLIHGAGGSHLVWPRQLRRIDGWRVIALDLPGHGRSDRPGYDSIAAYAEVVDHFLTALHIEQAIVAGHSMGGAIAQQLALTYPEKVAGLVLLNTGAAMTVNPDLLEMAQTDLHKAAEMISRWSWSRATTDDVRQRDVQIMVANGAAIVHGDFLACSRFDVCAKVSQISAPTFIVGGEKDKMMPLEHSTWLADNIAHSQMTTMPNGSHMMMLEQPEYVSTTIQDWLEDTFS